MTPTEKARESYRQEGAKVNATLALVIRHPGGLYFAGFGSGRNPNAPKVKWSVSLAEARMFNGSARIKAEKYIDRIKEKDSLYIGMKVVTVVAGIVCTTDGGKETVTHHTLKADGTRISVPKDPRDFTDCQKCGLEAKTLLHPFCTHADCPVRRIDSGKARP